MALDHRLVYPMLVHSPGVFSAECIAVTDTYDRAMDALAEWCFEALLELEVDNIPAGDNDAIIALYYEAMGPGHTYGVTATRYTFQVPGTA